MHQTKIDTLSKAQTKKWHPMQGKNKRERNIAWRSKQRLTATEKHNLFKIGLVILNWVFTHCYFCWYNWGTLSKDHTGTLCQHRQKGYSIQGSRSSKNHTLSRGTYLYSPGRGVPPPPPDCCLIGWLVAHPSLTKYLTFCGGKLIFVFYTMPETFENVSLLYG